MNLRCIKRLLFLLLIVTAPVWAFANEKHSDKLAKQELAAEIQNRLIGVAPNTVVVIVDQDTKTAYIRGSVKNQAEVDQITEALRSFDGVRVIGSNLVVTAQTAVAPVDAAVDASDRENDTDPVPELRTEDNSQTVPIPETIIASDASMNEAVKHALNSEGIIGQSVIRVETKDGIVTLTGTALSKSQADRIVQIARSVPGVLDVNANIQLLDEKRSYKVKPSPELDKEGRQIDQDNKDDDD